MWPYATSGSRFMGDVSEISPSALEAEDFSTNAVSISKRSMNPILPGLATL